MAATRDTFGAMRPLHVEPAALQTLALQCRGWAADLAAPSPPPCRSFPATAAAIATVHTEMGTAAEVMACRMRETADRLDEAAGNYRHDDSHSALALTESVIRP